MKLYAVKTRNVKTGDNIVDVILESLKKQGLRLEDGDVLALTSKIIAYSKGNISRLADVKPSANAIAIAKEFSLQPEFAQLILDEADKIYGGAQNAVLTMKNGVLAANAGVDNKNAPRGFVVLWPENVEESARCIRNEIVRRTGKQTAVLIVDSSVKPLRMGTGGLALAVAGFKPVIDCRGAKDIFGKRLVVTRHAIADDLACAAHLMMGEAAEKTPIVLIRKAPIILDEAVYGSRDMMISHDKCIFMNALGRS